MNDRDRKPPLDDSFVDELLDASLTRAREVKPRAGLEGRILTRVRAAREAQPRFGWWRVAAGVAVLVVAAMAARVALRPNPQPPAAVSRPAAQALVVPPPAQQVAHEPAPRHEPRVRRLGRGVQFASDEPRPKVFPSPRPLSEEEKLLLHAKDVPAGVLLAWSGNPDALRALEIKELDIPPLESEAPPDSGNEQK